ncbi:hypothetical protein [Luteimonas deserti]|uniref:HXXEE domain-containing protein n=1 Tax=Luteimonas deserti TaxID=2752306 RepID=A0A7Z0QQ48_9GAMM|nr:hypothetical protein [Luteimonas deserti]NYZ62769.1 hypothetical protein [Luteimonas deserti]
MACVALAELAHLAWEHLHGGIVSHHLLADPALPAIWNGWGLILLPALAWWASGRLARRLDRAADLRRVVLAGVFGFSVAALTGVFLSVAFVQGHENLAGLVLMAALGLAVLLRADRAECLLGFVLAMTFVFGAVLPVLIGSVVVVVSMLAHRIVYPLAYRLWRRLPRPAGG